jgi:hypothetical protein
VLIIYDAAVTTEESILDDHNAMHPKITHNIKTESNQQINYFDLSIHRMCKEITLGIYCKPTYSDMAIPYSSNHPRNHKMAAFNYLLNRVKKLPIMGEEKETKQIKLIAMINGCNMSNPASSYNKHKNNENITSKVGKKWVKFTYFREGIRTVTKTFKNARLKVAYSANNLIRNHSNVYRQLDKYNSSGVYKLKCLSSDQVYIDQWEGISLLDIRNTRDIRYNRTNQGMPNTYLTITMSVAQMKAQWMC